MLLLSLHSLFVSLTIRLFLDLLEEDVDWVGDGDDCCVLVVDLVLFGVDGVGWILELSHHLLFLRLKLQDEQRRGGTLLIHSQ